MEVQTMRRLSTHNHLAKILTTKFPRLKCVFNGHSIKVKFIIISNDCGFSLTTSRGRFTKIFLTKQTLCIINSIVWFNLQSIKFNSAQNFLTSVSNIARDDLMSLISCCRSKRKWNKFDKKKKNCTGIRFPNVNDIFFPQVVFKCGKLYQFDADKISVGGKFCQTEIHVSSFWIEVNVGKIFSWKKISFLLSQRKAFWHFIHLQWKISQRKDLF